MKRFTLIALAWVVLPTVGQAKVAWENEGPGSLPAARTLATALSRRGISGVSLKIETRRQRGRLALVAHLYDRGSGRLVHTHEARLTWDRLTRAQARKIATQIARRIPAFVRRRGGPENSSREEDSDEESTPGDAPLGSTMGDDRSVIYGIGSNEGTPEEIQVTTGGDGVLRSVGSAQHASRQPAVREASPAEVLDRAGETFESVAQHLSPEEIASDGLAVTGHRRVTPAGGRPIFDATLGVGVAWNRFHFTGATEALFNSGAYAEFRLSAQGRPLQLWTASKISRSKLARLGLELHYARSIGLSTASTAAEVGAAASRFWIGVNYWFEPFSSWYAPTIDVRFGGGFDSLSFAQQTAPVQDVTLSHLGLGATFRFPLRPFARPFASIDYRPLLSGSSVLLSRHEASAFSAHGVSIGLGVDGSLMWGLGYRAELYYQRMGGVMSSTTAGVPTIGMAHRIVAFGVSALYQY